MADDGQNAWEEALLADIREHDGRPTTGPLAGHPLLVLYSTGAKSGARRRAILTFTKDGDAYVVAGSAGGAPVDPSWLTNVAVHPDVTIEIGKTTFEATAAIIEGPDHDRLWDAHVQALPWFGDYPTKAGREIPVVKLTPHAA